MRFTEGDERRHAADPEIWSWNESWFFSFIDLDGGPAGFFRVGLLPNQRRAMLWNFVHVDGAWLGIEESRLGFDDFELAEGLAYDRWGMQFAWRPDPSLSGARFSFEGSLLARTGPNAGAWVPVSIDLRCQATTACEGTRSGSAADASSYPIDRFEQSLQATGRLVVDGETREVHAGAHRDRSWGPREWRVAFVLGDLQGGGRQLYFACPSAGAGFGFERDGTGELVQLRWTSDSIDCDDRARTVAPSRMAFERPDGTRFDVEVEPIAPSVAFDMAHTCEEPEHWLYWRTLIQAKVPGWDAPCRGWFEANRYGV
jgi:hypothetical protein